VTNVLDAVAFLNPDLASKNVPAVCQPFEILAAGS
jgi:hypothetical protein